MSKHRIPAEAILFDFDGTLVDAMPGFTKTAVRLICSNYDGISEDEARRKYLATAGKDFASQLESIFPGHQRNSCVSLEFERIKRNTMLSHPLFPEVLAALNLVSACGIPLYICSSTQHDLISHYATAKKIDAYFDEILGYQVLETMARVSESDGVLQAASVLDKGRQILAVCSRYNVKPERAVFVGDTLADLKFARQCSVPFVGVARGYGQSAFSESGVPWIDALTKLPEVVELNVRRSSG